MGITFQRFDKAWDEYVDFYKNCQLNNRDKLKAVVLPLLSDLVSQSATSTVQSDVSFFNYTVFSHSVTFVM